MTTSPVVVVLPVQVLRRTVLTGMLGLPLLVRLPFVKPPHPTPHPTPTTTTSSTSSSSTTTPLPCYPGTCPGPYTYPTA